MEFTPWSLSVRTCQRRLAGHELPLKAAMLALSCFLCGSIWSFFSKRDNLGGEAYASETEPEEWISVSLVYTASSRSTGVGGMRPCGSMGRVRMDLQPHSLKMLTLVIIATTSHNND